MPIEPSAQLGETVQSIWRSRWSFRLGESLSQTGLGGDGNVNHVAERFIAFYMFPVCSDEIIQYAVGESWRDGSDHHSDGHSQPTRNSQSIALNQCRDLLHNTRRCTRLSGNRSRCSHP